VLFKSAFDKEPYISSDLVFLLFNVAKIYHVQ